MRHPFRICCCRISFTLIAFLASSSVADTMLETTLSFGRDRCPSESLADVVIVGVRSVIHCGIKCMRLSSSSPDGGNRCIEYSYRSHEQTCALFTNATGRSTFDAEINCVHFTVGLIKWRLCNSHVHYLARLCSTVMATWAFTAAAEAHWMAFFLASFSWLMRTKTFKFRQFR